jgi:predicted transcriptional regulator
MTRFGVSPKAKLSGLKALEGAGLIAVERRVGRNPLVTILEVGHG